MSTNLHQSGIIYGVWVFVCFLMCLGWLIKLFLALIPKVQILVKIPYRKHYRSFIGMFLIPMLLQAAISQE